MNTLCVKIASSISADGFDVRVQDPDENKVFEHQYRYGYDASYSKINAQCAHEDVEKAAKYKWQGMYKEKPYTTDILIELVSKYDVDKLFVSANKYVFSGKQIPDSEISEFITKYILPNSQLSELCSNQY